MGDGGAARVTAAAARALIRAMGMQAANASCAVFQEPPRFDLADFEAVIEDERIDWNSVQEETHG